MTKTERREYHTTKVVRTVSPHRTYSNQNVTTTTNFDNNLDNLLEDLQSSVSRPGSSLGNTTTNREYKETRTVYGGDSKRGDSLNRIQHISAANPTTVMSSTDETYYNKPGESVRSAKIYKENYTSYNVKRDVSPEKYRIQNNINKLDTLLDDLQQARQDSSSTGIDSGLLDSSGGSKMMNKKTVHRELVYDSDSSQRRRREGSVGRDIEYISEGYGSVRQPSPSRTLQNSKIQSYNYESSTESKNILSPKTEIIETMNPDINPNVLAQLDHSLLPPPNTKVTTTIKTYTYEIPGSGYPSTVSPKLSETVFSSNPSTPSKSFYYNKLENETVERSVNDYVRPVSPQPVGHVRHQVETIQKETRNAPEPISGYSYKETTRTTRNMNTPPLASRQPHHYNETSTTTNTTTNRNGYVPNQNQSYRPQSPVNISYKYSSERTNTNNYRGRVNDEVEPLLQPRPFPTHSSDIDGPPKKLDQLMAEIGNEPPNNAYNAGYNARQTELAQKREVEHLTQEAQTKQEKETNVKDLPKTKNIVGPAVYYPPGHELFAQKEESSGQYAQGGMMKEKAKYKYEAKSGSKEKSSSGKMIVPVCLPLCCGLPCVIM